jgi:hypothetical protein
MQTTVAAVLALLALATTTAAAEPLEGDVEIDPTAYALSGHSLHAGIARGHWRVDLGNFGLEMPRAIHGNDAFDASFTGYGAKLQYFARASRTGWFAGVDAAVATTHARLRGTDLTASDTSFAVGVHGGYRVALPANLYATLWLGVGYNAGARDLVLEGKRFEAMPVNVFPAVHLGYRFR